VFNWISENRSSRESLFSLFVQYPLNFRFYLSGNCPGQRKLICEGSGDIVLCQDNGIESVDNPTPKEGHCHEEEKNKTDDFSRLNT
jgi:hypothetical protein